MDGKKEYKKGLALALLNSVSLGIVGLVDKIGSTSVQNPLIFSAQSVSMSLVFFILFITLFHRQSFVRQFQKTSLPAWSLVALVGLLASGFFVLFRFLGLLESTGTFATLSQIVTTALTAIGAYLFLKERMKKSFWLLFLLILFSMYVISAGTIALVSIKNGDAYILIGTLFLASSNIFAKVALKKTTPLVLSLGRFFFGAVFLLLVNVLFFHQTAGLFALSPWVVMSGFLWFINVTAFNFAIKYVGVTLATTLLMPSPIYTLILETVLLQYHFSPLQILAALVVVTCGVMTIVPGKKNIVAKA